MNLIKSKIFVALGSEVNTGKFEQYSTNAKFEELSKPNGLIYYEVKDLEEASSICRKFIQTYSLGSGNWLGGRVINEKSDFLARISYNGRIWDNENWEIANELAI
ncbi:hypothetical protein [Polaribacter glomeratus]|uniref:Uncharacterized protein n=1 Tax=Polaribacter glomeratus TaxID=102 RepID=A0A2S7WY11_9FLAO|nr:hypothetical protein [Polaribacter glomeratus]PQJ82464.1 hypothetical protein BTO16_07670 [Polaribacter glomeratus]TXD64296.1 hypothetical protein ESX12_15420 [Polaribacter glomeratus]